jgi:hypothetical protein
MAGSRAPALQQQQQQQQQQWCDYASADDRQLTEEDSLTGTQQNAATKHTKLRRSSIASHCNARMKHAILSFLYYCILSKSRHKALPESADSAAASFSSSSDMHINSDVQINKR